MKRIISIISILTVFVLLIGCSSIELDTEPASAEPEQVEPENSEASQEEPRSEPVEKIPEEIQDLLNKQGRVKSLSYEYVVDDPTSSQRQLTSIKGNTLKIQLLEEINVLHSVELDAVILDLNGEEGMGYCEDVDYCVATGEVDEVYFNDYYVDTPLDWNAKIVTAEKLGEENLQNRNVWKVLVNSDDLYWIESYYGIPLKVESQGEVHFFESTVFNGVRDADLEFAER